MEKAKAAEAAAISEAAELAKEVAALGNSEEAFKAAVAASDQPMRLKIAQQLLEERRARDPASRRQKPY